MFSWIRKTNVFFNELLSISSPAIVSLLIPVTGNSLAGLYDGYLLMAVPKRPKSARMKERARADIRKWPKEQPYTLCDTCGSPRRLYFMCENCYNEVKVHTQQLQHDYLNRIEDFKSKVKMEKLRWKHTPMPFEERIKPWIEKYSFERLQPQPLNPREKPFQENIEAYKSWYVEDGGEVIKPKLETDITYVSDDDSPAEITDVEDTTEDTIEDSPKDSLDPL